MGRYLHRNIDEEAESARREALVHLQAYSVDLERSSAALSMLLKNEITN